MDAAGNDGREVCRHLKDNQNLVETKGQDQDRKVQSNDAKILQDVPQSAACRCPQHLGAIEEEARSEGMGTQPPSTTSAQPELPEVIAAQPM